MLENDLMEKLRKNFEKVDSEEVLKTLQDALDQGISAETILGEGLTKGMRRVGELYEKCEYFVSDLVWAGEIMKKAFTILQPKLHNGTVSSLGTIVIGTVVGDIHDIGKNIFNVLAENEGFKVVDLGVDVTPKTFIKAVKEKNAKILGISCLLSTTMAEVPNVIKAIEEEKIRDRIKIIVGGAPIDSEFAKKVGADAGVNDAMAGVRFCREFLKQEGGS